MKRILVLFLVLMFASSVYAFEAGTKNVGGWIEWESIKIDSDTDPITALSIYPWIGYFFMDNICVDIMLEYTSVNYGETDVKEIGRAHV